MMRILELAGKSFLYFSAASVAALIGVLVVLGLKGHLGREQTYRVVAAAYGVETATGAASAEPADPQVAYEEVLEKRALAGMDLDLRKQALDNAMNDVLAQRTQLDDDRKKYDIVLADFEKRLEELKQGTANRQLLDLQQTIETMRPEQAKEQLLLLLEDGRKTEVVTLVKQMARDMRKKILAEFTPEDKDTLHEILKHILASSEEAQLIDKTRQQVDQFQDSQT